MVEPLPLIELSGPPRERGRQYGKQAAARIRLGIQHYREQLSRTDFAWPDIEAQVRAYVPVMEGYAANQVEEMRGIAEGAGLEFEQIAFLNARTEILKLAARPDLRAKLAASDEPDGCTGVIVLPEATANGRLIHAQNWDWKAECAETAVVLRIRNDDGPDMLCFAEAGQMARCGMNAAGIVITANYLESDRDYARLGVPLPLIRRKVLEQQQLALAFHTVYTTPKSGSNNMMVSQTEGVAIDFECAPDETFQVHASGGMIVHANHWQSPVALAKLKDTGVAGTPDSLYRDMRVRHLLASQAGSINREAVKTALFDDFGHPWSVCRPPRRSLTQNLSATVAMIVMEPASGVMDVCMLPALNRQFQSFRLDMQGAPRAVEKVA
ncbi:MAG: C45 family autoproteolytic acyltransferase/hydrolase [Alphaproteobacteria bacterium]